MKSIKYPRCGKRKQIDTTPGSVCKLRALLTRNEQVESMERGLFIILCLPCYFSICSFIIHLGVHTKSLYSSCLSSDRPLKIFLITTTWLLQLLSLLKTEIFVINLLKGYKRKCHKAPEKVNS